MKKYIRKIVTIPSTGNSSGAVIFLHGSGDSGPECRRWIKVLLGLNAAFHHMQIIFPTAPRRSYTAASGLEGNIWFDRSQISPDVREDSDTLEETAQQLSKFIEDVVNDGVERNRIVIGGYSMGGAMALHMGYRFFPQVAGVFALSSFLNFDSAVYEALRKRKEEGINTPLPPLCCFHGDCDQLVYSDWGKKTFKRLTNLGVQGNFYVVKGMTHEMKKTELVMLYDWIESLVKDESLT